MQLLQRYSALSNTSNSDDNVGPVEEEEVPASSPGESMQLLLRQARDSYKYSSPVTVRRIVGTADVEIGERTISDLQILSPPNYNVNAKTMLTSKSENYFMDGSSKFGIKVGNIKIIATNAEDRDYIWDFITGITPSTI